MMLAVVEPQSSGPGGGSLLLVWDARVRKLAFYEGLASAPALMPVDWAHTADGGAIDLHVLDCTGPVVGVPGTLRTLALVDAKTGKLPWERLFRDAIATADGGFAMPHYLHTILSERPELAHEAAFAGYFDATGVPLPVGAMLHNPELAATLRQIATRGAEALHGGAIAQDIVAETTSGRYPGTLTADDLAGYQVHQRDPVCLVAFDRRICRGFPVRPQSKISGMGRESRKSG